MEIFERYIREVIRHLPRGQRDDVAKELRSTLEDSLDGRIAGTEQTLRDAQPAFDEVLLIEPGTLDENLAALAALHPT